MSKEDKKAIYIALGVLVFLISMSFLGKWFFNGLNNNGCKNQYGKDYKYVFENDRDYCINGADKKLL